MRANTLRKGQRVRGLTVRTDGYFAKRREVMAVIYELKKLVDLPRIEVKIADSASSTLGLGYTDERHTIVVSGDVAGRDLFHVVLHEIVHTVFKVRGHDESCPLMASRLGKAPKSELLNAFLQWHKKSLV